MATGDTNHHCSSACCHGLHGSRRSFLASCAALAGAGVALPIAARAEAADLSGYVDAAGLRPRPRVKVMMAIVRLQPPYWLGWPGTSYDLEGFRAKYTEEIQRIGQEIGVRVDVAPAPLENEGQVGEFLTRVAEEKPDAVLLLPQHMAVWPWMQRVADTVKPTIIFAPVGVSFTGHTLGIARQPGVHVVSSLEVDGVRQALLMVRGKRQLEETRVLWIHGDRREETVLPILGTKVRQIPRRVFNELFDRMPETDEVRELADRMPRVAKRVVEPTHATLLNASRTYTTAKRLLADEGANALSMDCLGMVGSRIVPTPPCMAWSLLQDTGVTAGCEADLFGAISLMFTSYVLDRPGYMNDPVAETFKNRLITSHCTCGTRLAGFDKPPVPIILRSHSESDIGVSTQVLWPEGQPCSLIRFNSPGEILLDTGTVEANVDTPPAGGCRTCLEVTMDRVEDALDVAGFHQVVTLGDHRRIVESYAQLYGLKVTHSPERAPEGTDA
jgi:hypothetical protein